ncbi:hypothetical protein Lal_00042341 [Lupinus albus]|nr:hypothetical protein Lal_00042341 [Lupinus albus]
MSFKTRVSFKIKRFSLKQRLLAQARSSLIFEFQTLMLSLKRQSLAQERITQSPLPPSRLSDLLNSLSLKRAHSRSSENPIKILGENSDALAWARSSRSSEIRPVSVTIHHVTFHFPSCISIIHLIPKHFQCPAYLKKVEGEKNTSWDFKSKKAYIVLDIPEEDSTTSTSREEETANICLMRAPLEKLTNLESSDNSPTYNELYSAFLELHEELKKVVKVSVDRERLILLQEKKIGNMQKEIDELKLENKTLDLIYSNASCMCSSKLTKTPVCETCHEFKNENDDLTNKMTKFTYNSQNLNRLLASSNNVGNRTSLSFKRKNHKRPTRKLVRHRIETTELTGNTPIPAVPNTLLGNRDPFYAPQLQLTRLAKFEGRAMTPTAYTNLS